VRLTKILLGFIAINVTLVALLAFVFFLARPLVEGTALFLLATALVLLAINGLGSGLIIKNLARPLKKLTRHLDGQARCLEATAGRLNGTAQAALETSAQSSALLEDAAARLSQISGLIMRGVNTASEARDVLVEISQLVSQVGEFLGKIDTSLCLAASSATDVSAETVQLSGRAEELLEAIDELSALIDGTEAPDYREVSLKTRLTRQMLVKALPLADAS
jgi:methyl-accepting chemotaxis protein